MSPSPQAEPTMPELTPLPADCTHWLSEFNLCKRCLHKLPIGLLDTYRGILKTAQSPTHTQPAHFTLLLE